MIKQNKIVAAFFDNLTKQYGFDHKSLAYGSKETQLIKFQALVEVGLNKEKGIKSVLDVGCGFGDLADFMKSRGIKFKYTGIDISKEAVILANTKKPNLNIKQQDILEMRGNDIFDYVVTTGFNCLKHGKNWDLLTKSAVRIFALAKKAVAIGVVSSYRTKKNRQTYYTSPEKFFRFCMKNITTKIVLRHDYLPHDFTIYLYK